MRALLLYSQPGVAYYNKRNNLWLATLTGLRLIIAITARGKRTTRISIQLWLRKIIDKQLTIHAENEEKGMEISKENRPISVAEPGTAEILMFTQLNKSRAACLWILSSILHNTSHPSCYTSTWCSSMCSRAILNFSLLN